MPYAAALSPRTSEALLPGGGQLGIFRQSGGFGQALSALWGLVHGLEKALCFLPSNGLEAKVQGFHGLAGAVP